jgi:antitoxin component of MazEF toxin-antitoxin module
MELHQEIGKWGNSLGLRIPSVVAESMGLRQGDDVSIVIKDNAIVITPSKTLTLEERLAGFDMQAACKRYAQCDPIPDDVMDFIHMEPVGREIL